MPYTTELIAGGTGIYHEGIGVLTGEEMIAAGLATHSSPEIARRLTHALVDLSAVTDFQVTPADLRMLASENLVTSRLVPRAFVAVVAPADHIFGSIRMWRVFAGETGWVTEVFRSRDLAETWLRECLARLPKNPD